MKKVITKIFLTLRQGTGFLFAEKAIFPCLLLLFTSIALFSQTNERIVKGKVTDENSQPLGGVSIRLKNTNSGTMTNDVGEYSISVSDKSAILVFSSAGMKDQEISIGGKTIVDVIMEADVLSLDEVVAIGYGTEKKKDLTGAIGIVKSNDIVQKNESQLSTSLQGLASGMTVTRNSSVPGKNSSTIRIRGITTLGNSNPLVLVDGIPVDNIDLVNPTDVENISILKDAASAAIYGSRAAAGVILITTKHARSGKLELSYSGLYGTNVPTEFPASVGIKRYMEMINEVAWNDGGNQSGGEYTEYSQDEINNYIENNKSDPENYPISNWKKVLLNNSAPFTRHSLSMNYGNNVIKFLGSIGYEYGEALYNNKSFERISSRINSRVKATDFLSFESNIFYSHSIDKSPILNPVEFAYEYPSIQWPPYWSDGVVAPGRLGTNPWARLNFGGFDNTFGDQFLGKFSIDLEPIKNLVISGVLMPSIGSYSRKTFIKKIPYYSETDHDQMVGYITGNTTTNLSESRPEERSLTKQLLVNYERIKIGSNHNLSLLAGYEDYYNRIENLTVSSDNLALNNFPYMDRGNPGQIRSTGDAEEVAYRSYFGRLSYNFAQKYFLQTNMRVDGSSRFYKDNRWGSFPSIAMGWVPTEESFFKNIDWISFLKLRASLGSLGNDRIGKYPYQGILNFDNVLTIVGNEIIPIPTAFQNRLNIQDITWETTKVWNFGIDASFFRNRLSLTYDYYLKNTSDILLPLAIPTFIGYANPEQNAGKMRTKGWDFNIGWMDIINSFKYSINFNISDYKSTMGNLGGTVFLGDQIIQQGSLYHEWYGYVSQGLFQSKDDINNSALLTSAVKPGDVKYKDISGPNGTPDGRISPEYDKVLLGGSLPRFVYGGNINLNFKNFDLSLMFQGVGKQLSRLESKMVYQIVQWYNFPEFLDGNYFSEYNSAEKNKKARYPRLSQAGFLGNNYEMSDFWLIDGSYFRVKNVTLGYQLPDNILKSIKLSTAMSKS